jgi:hypothetical protein
MIINFNCEQTNNKLRFLSKHLLILPLKLWKGDLPSLYLLVLVPLPLNTLCVLEFNSFVPSFPVTPPQFISN